MNRNSFLLQLGIALILILVAAFAGQVRKWQQQARSAEQPSQPTERRAVLVAERELPGVFNQFGQPEVLVRFREGTSADAIRRITSRFHDRVDDEIEAVPGLLSIDDLDDADPSTIVAEYQALPEVEYAEPNYLILLDHVGGGYKHLHPDDPLFTRQWALANEGQNGGKEGADISAMRAWAVTRGSEQVVVAVLDSGVDYTHFDLVRNIWVRPAGVEPYQDRSLGVIEDIHGYNAVDNNGDPMDENGHGTHCAGIIGAEGGNSEGIAGVNWTVRIMPLKFLNAGGFGTTKDAIECVNYAIDRRRAGVNIRVISASFGSAQKSRAFEDVIRRAYEAGILFVAASGNASTDTDRRPHYPSSYNIGNIISVAALDRTDELARFSNFGSRTVHLAAPGAEILSTWLRNDFEEHSGTSMAAPLVAGVAALLIAKEPRLSVDEVRRRLLDAVDPLPSLRGKVATGGRINAARAVRVE